MSRSRLHTTGGALLPKIADLFVYVFGVLVAAVLGSTLVTAPFAGTFLLVKFLLFLVGFSLLAFGTVSLWPALPTDPEEADPPAVTERELSPFESALASVFSRVDDRYPPTERFSPGFKLFVAGCVVLLVSYLMEAALGVGVE